MTLIHKNINSKKKVKFDPGLTHPDFDGSADIRISREPITGEESGEGFRGRDCQKVYNATNELGVDWRLGLGDIGSKGRTGLGKCSFIKENN